MRPSRLTSAGAHPFESPGRVIWPDAVHPGRRWFKFSAWSADELEVVQIASVMRKLRDRLGRDDGYTLVELITVMAILGIVLAPLSSSFASGMVHQASQTRREQAYANARVALQRLRLDVHCASAVTSVEQNAYGGFTLTLTESNDQSPGGLVPRRHPRGRRLVRRSVVHGSLRGLDDAIRPLPIPRDESHRLRRRHAARRSRPATSPRSRGPGRRTRRPSGAQGAVRRRAGSGTSGRHG